MPRLDCRLRTDIKKAQDPVSLCDPTYPIIVGFLNPTGRVQAENFATAVSSTGHFDIN